MAHNATMIWRKAKEKQDCYYFKNTFWTILNFIFFQILLYCETHCNSAISSQKIYAN